jgi:hypothetical protein
MHGVHAKGLLCQHGIVVLKKKQHSEFFCTAQDSLSPVFFLVSVVLVTPMHEGWVSLIV